MASESKRINAPIPAPALAQRRLERGTRIDPTLSPKEGDKGGAPAIVGRSRREGYPPLPLVRQTKDLEVSSAAERTYTISLKTRLLDVSVRLEVEALNSSIVSIFLGYEISGG